MPAFSNVRPSLVIEIFVNNANFILLSINTPLRCIINNKHSGQDMVKYKNISNLDDES